MNHLLRKAKALSPRLANFFTFDQVRNGTSFCCEEQIYLFYFPVPGSLTHLRLYMWCALGKYRQFNRHTFLLPHCILRKN